MPPADALLTPDVAILCRAIDAGDDTALGPLADALEECGDARAAGLRLVGDKRPYDAAICGEWWWGTGGGALPRVAQLDEKTYRRLAADEHGVRSFYPTRNAAFLALAAALTQETRNAPR